MENSLFEDWKKYLLTDRENRLHAKRNCQALGKKIDIEKPLREKYAITRFHFVV